MAGVAWRAIGSSASGMKRKRKKRRKKKLPHDFSTCGRARRRQRQCLLGCFVFPSVDDWPQMLGIMASMDQKDSIPRLWCAHRRLRQWHVQGWFYWLCSSCSIPSSCRQAKLLGISVGMDLRDSFAALVVVTAVDCAWLIFLVTLLSRCILFDCRQALVAGVRCPFAQRHASWSRQCRCAGSCSSWTRLVTRPLRLWSPQVQFFDEVMVI